MDIIYTGREGLRAPYSETTAEIYLSDVGCDDLLSFVTVPHYVCRSGILGTFGQLIIDYCKTQPPASNG